MFLSKDDIKILLRYTKARRSAIAKKAADTRRRRNANKKKPSKTKRRKKQKEGREKAKKFRDKVARFIKGKLREKIIQDLKEFRISSEQDLRSSITFHLRKHLGLNPRTSKYRLATELPVRRQLTGSANPKRVDVVIQYKPTKTFAIYKPDIMIEIKEHHALKENDLRHDIRKLKKFRKAGICKWGFLIYLCQIKAEDGVKKPISDKDLQQRAKRLVRLESEERIIPIIINAYHNLTHAQGELFDEMWEASKEFDRRKETAAKAARTRNRQK